MAADARAGRTLTRLWCAAAAVALACASAAHAQVDSAIASIPHPRVAVVLSGGSAKGLAHIGVLQVLEQLHVPVDIVTGTSMGAIIGGIYSVGYSAEDLEAIMSSTDMENLFRRPTDRRQLRPMRKAEDARYTVTFPLSGRSVGLPTAVVSRQAIAERIEKYTWPAHGVTDFTTLPRAFGALVTDLGTGDPILLHKGYLAQAIEASAAVPGAFAPVRLYDGRIVVDGGAVRNLPAVNARDLGADLVICVDVSERIEPADSLRSIVDIVNQTVAFRVQASTSRQRKLCNVVIDPDIEGLPSLDFSQAAVWVARGRVAAQEHAAELAAIADSVRKLRGIVPVRRVLPRDDSIRVHAVRWTPVSAGADVLVRGAVGLEAGDWVSAGSAAAAVTRIYATGRFDQVSYRIVPDSAGDALVFDLSEGYRDALGVGVRYDSHFGAAFLASAVIHDLGTPGSQATLSARIGDEQVYDAQYSVGADANTHLVRTVQATYLRTPLRVLENTGSPLPPVLDVRRISAQLAGVVSTSTVAAVELAHEWSRDGLPADTGLFAAKTQAYTSLAATVEADTYDQAFMPARGVSLRWRAEVADRSVGAGASFVRHFLSADGALPVLPRTSLLGGITLGHALGEDLPLHDRFYLGGALPSLVWPAQFVPFLGLNPQSQSGRAVQVAQAGIRAQVTGGVAVALRANVGNVFEAWPTHFDARQYQSGFGVTVGTQLAPGPLALTVAARTLHSRPVIELEFGAAF